MILPKLVIFDCDGVLIDSEVLSCQAMIENLAREHGITITIKEILERYLGKSGASTIIDLEKRYGIKLSPDYATKSRAILSRLFEESLEAMPGITALLDTLPVKKCIASSSSPYRLQHSLGLTRLWDRFAPHIFSAAQVQNGKPAPDLFLFAAEQMQTAPSDCLVIEDSVAGVQAARAAGMRVYGFTGGSHCYPGYSDKLRHEGAEHIFASMDELAKILCAPDLKVANA